MPPYARQIPALPVAPENHEGPVHRRTLTVRNVDGETGGIRIPSSGFRVFEAGWIVDVGGDVEEPLVPPPAGDGGDGFRAMVPPLTGGPRGIDRGVQAVIHVPVDPLAVLPELVPLVVLAAASDDADRDEHRSSAGRVQYRLLPAGSVVLRQDHQRLEVLGLVTEGHERILPVVGEPGVKASNGFAIGVRRRHRIHERRPVAPVPGKAVPPERAPRRGRVDAGIGLVPQPLAARHAVMLRRVFPVGRVDAGRKLVDDAGMDDPPVIDGCGTFHLRPLLHHISNGGGIGILDESYVRQFLRLVIDLLRVVEQDALLPSPEHGPQYLHGKVGRGETDLVPVRILHFF